jgi:hypothetical protein
MGPPWPICLIRQLDTNGTEIERSEYFPYGAIESSGSEKYGFMVQENDANTGLMYYGAWGEVLFP